ncbi:11418_t:CDS:2 [Entrophospora sp. SA101]|nr:11418_t:CDS:2 [Entrophospora sp. SA101]
MDLKLICQESATNASTTEAATVTSMTINSKNKAIDLKIDNDNSQQTQSLPPSEFGNDNNAIAPTSTSQSHSQLQQFPSQQLTAVAVTSQPSSSSRSSTPSAPPPQSHLQQGQLLTPPYNKDPIPQHPSHHQRLHPYYNNNNNDNNGNGSHHYNPSLEYYQQYLEKEMHQNRQTLLSIDGNGNSHEQGHISDLINKTFEVLYALNALKDETIRKGPVKKEQNDWHPREDVTRVTYKKHPNGVEALMEQELYVTLVVCISPN